MKRTHRLMLVLNYAVSFHNDNNVYYMEYDELKQYMTRKEMISFYAALKNGDRYIELSGNKVQQVMGV